MLPAGFIDLTCPECGGSSAVPLKALNETEVRVECVRCRKTFGPSLSDRLHGRLRQASPHTCCVPCLAKTLNIDEKDVRDAAQVIITSAAVRLPHAACRLCLKTTECLSTGEK